MGWFWCVNNVANTAALILRFHVREFDFDLGLAVRAGIGLETDIYAFGIVMWEVWTRCAAWHWMGANAEFQICNRVGILKQRPRMPPFVGTHQARIATMIRKCLHDNPAKRPTAAQLVEAQLYMVRQIRTNSSNHVSVRESSQHNQSLSRWTDKVTEDFASSYADTGGPVRGGTYALVLSACRRNAYGAQLHTHACA